MKKKFIGSDFDDFLKEENIYDSVSATAIKRVIAYQLCKEMQKKKITQTEMAKRLKTSRAALVRLLDPKNVSVTLLTLNKVAAAVGKRLQLRLVGLGFFK